MSAPAQTSEAGDGQLMALIASGDTAAFEQLYDRYSARAYAVARSVCQDTAQAERALQEAFVSIWRQRSSYRTERGTVGSWLLRVVHHRAIEVAREGKPPAKRVDDADSIESRRALRSLVGRILARNRASHLRTHLDRLPNAQREVIALAYYGRLSHAEIATQLALPTVAVKGRMRLGLQKLRAEIEEAA